MKKIHKVLSITVLLATLFACDVEKITSLKDDFQISVSPDAVVSKMEINVVNAKPDANGEFAPLSDAKIVFSDNSANKIFTIGGNKAVNNSFDIKDGLVILGVKASESVNEDNPLTIDATITAEGYFNLPVQITFTGSNVTSTNFTLTEKDNMPNGTTFDSMTLSGADLKDNKTTKAISSTISSTTTDIEGNEVEEQIEMTIPADTGFLDENGLLVDASEVELQVQTFSSAGVEGDGFPGGLGIDEITDASTSANKRGTSKKTKSTSDYIYASGNIVIPVTNLYCMYGYARTVYLSNCTRKSVIRNYFYYRGRNVTNPLTGESVKEGDLIDVYHKWNRYDGNTTYLTKGLVKYDTRYGKYYCEFETDRFGIFPMGFTMKNTGCNPTSFSGLTLTNSGSPGYYRFLIYNKFTPYNYIGYGGFYLGSELKIGSSDLIYNYYFRKFKNLMGPNMRLRIDAYSYQQRRYVKLYDQEATICNLDGKSIELTHPDCTQNVNLNLNITCPDVNISLNYSPIYYKPASSPYWRRYGYIYRGYVRAYAPCLEDNEDYKFAVWYNGFKESPTVKGSTVKTAIDLQPEKICAELPGL
jgi:hypothetical protein